MQTPHRPAHAGYPEQGTQPTNTPFKFKLTQQLLVSVSAEQGECIARSEHAAAEPQYLLRYRAADGRAVEAWWTEGALAAVAEASTADVGGQTAAPAASADDLLDRHNAWLSRRQARVEPEAAAQLPLHPSRSAPKCEDCRHYVVVRNIKPACNHPLQPVSLDDGRPVVYPYRARTDGKSCAARGDFFCGLSGIGFAPRVS